MILAWIRAEIPAAMTMKSVTLPPTIAARLRFSVPPRRHRAIEASITKASINRELNSPRRVHGLLTPSGMATVSPRKSRCRSPVISRKFKFGGKAKLRANETRRAPIAAIPSQRRPVPK